MADLLLIIGSRRAAAIAALAGRRLRGLRWLGLRFGLGILRREGLVGLGVIWLLSRSLGLVYRRPVNSLPEIGWRGRLCPWVGLACRR